MGRVPYRGNLVRVYIEPTSFVRDQLLFSNDDNRLAALKDPIETNTQSKMKSLTMSQHYTVVDLTKDANPTPFDVANEVFAKGLKYQKPPLSFRPALLEEQAEKVLSANAWGYVHNSAGIGETDHANRNAFKKWSFIPRRLTGQQKFPDLSVTLFGKKYPYPIAVAPIGVQRIFNPDGELFTAAAAAKEHVPYIMSTAAATSIEDVAEANGDSGERWFQLYWPANQHNDITASMLSRAQNSGYDVLVVNVDTFIIGWRPGDLDNGYSPFLRPDQIGVAIGFTDPLYRKMFKKNTGKEIEEDLATAAANWAKIFIPGYPHAWDDLKFLKEHWKGPIVIKGVQSVEDARKCVEMGMDGVYVSNHGGRQVDGGIASLDVLEEIADAVGDKVKIIFDSGIRSGVDVAKALALGADMVAIGRPWVWGLALEGQIGVEHVLRSIVGELDLTLHLNGISSVARLDKSWLRKAE